MWLLHALARALALCLGTFCLAHALRIAVATSGDGSEWLIDLRWLPTPLRFVALAGCGAALAGFTLRPGLRMSRIAAAAAAALAFVAVIDAARYNRLLATGLLTGAPLAFSLLVAIAAACVAIAALRFREPLSRTRSCVMLVLSGMLTVAFPLLQMATFGNTDYRRPADAILIFGARVYADGSPSHALQDRVNTGATLYEAGLAPVVIVSGGPSDGPTDEPEAMRQMLIRRGVPDSAIVCDHHGLDTNASIRTAAILSRERGWRSVLAVSHFYHLPRIKMLSQREGLTAFTVPSPQGQPLQRLPRFMLRETAACIYHWASGVLR